MKIAFAWSLCACWAACRALEVEAAPSALTIIPSTDFYGPGVQHLNLSFSRLGAPVRQSQGSAGLSLGFQNRVSRQDPRSAQTPGASGTLSGEEAQETSNARLRALDQAEVGFDVSVLRLRDSQGTRAAIGDTFVLNAKALLFDSGQGNGGGQSSVRVAAGGFNLGNSSSGRTAYLIASRDFDEPGRVHLGAWRTFNKSAFGGRNYTQLLLGYEKTVGPRLTLLADHASGHGPAGATALSAIYALSDRSGLQFAIARPNGRQARQDSGSVALLLSYDADL